MGWLLLMIPLLDFGRVGGLIVSVKVWIGPWILFFYHFYLLSIFQGSIAVLKQPGRNNLYGKRRFDLIPARIDC